MEKSILDNRQSPFIVHGIFNEFGSSWLPTRKQARLLEQKERGLPDGLGLCLREILLSVFESGVPHLDGPIVHSINNGYKLEWGSRCII